MKYDHVVTGTFISRPNRFIARCQIGQEIVTVHVKNTGRCREILIPGTEVILSVPDNPDRKTKYDLIAAYKGDLLINIDSQSPNKAFHEYILESGVFGDDPKVHPEYTHGDSRFDFYVETGDRRILIEVKGVTLEHDGICSFPDAPTERGVKHVRGLVSALSEGYEARIALVVQMGRMTMFEPNYATHEEFGIELERAEVAGVEVMVLGCDVTEDSMSISYSIPHRYHS